MNATLTPQARPQPDRDSYGLEELELYPRLTRAVFKQTFGFQAPPYNPREIIRRFFDTSAAGQPDEPYTYGSWTVVDGKPYYRRIVITVAQARVPNLPGAYDYAKYVVQPTGAFWQSQVDGMQNTPINPDYLSTSKEASDLTAELSRLSGLIVGDVTEQNLSNPAVKLIYPDDEPRRVYVVNINGDSHNIGLLRNMKLARGVDAPGHWTVSDNQPLWISDIPLDTGELNAELPSPHRELLQNERIEIAFGGILVVRRTDRESTQLIDDETAQAARVREILDRVISIQRQVGVPL